MAVKRVGIVLAAARPQEQPPRRLHQTGVQVGSVIDIMEGLNERQSTRKALIDNFRDCNVKIFHF